MWPRCPSLTSLPPGRALEFTQPSLATIIYQARQVHWRLPSRSAWTLARGSRAWTRWRATAGPGLPRRLARRAPGMLRSGASWSLWWIARSSARSSRSRSSWTPERYGARPGATILRGWRRAFSYRRRPARSMTSAASRRRRRSRARADSCPDRRRRRAGPNCRAQLMTVPATPGSRRTTPRRTRGTMIGDSVVICPRQKLDERHGDEDGAPGRSRSARGRALAAKMAAA